MVARALHAALPTAASAPVAFASFSSPVFSSSSFAVAGCIAEPTSPWGATVTPARLVSPAADHPVPPASREEARALRDGLSRLITRERHSAADFLVALADFDQRRGWEALGHRSLFDFLKRELKCSSGAASHRSAAARLIPRFPAVEAALRAGDLCLSSLRHLARVLRPENEADYLPRFFGLSAREAEALAAELLPRAVQPRREVVTLLKPVHPVHTCEQARPERGQRGETAAQPAPELTRSLLSSAPTSVSASTPAVSVLPLPSGERAGVRGAMTNSTLPLQAPLPTREVEPLSADLRRLHLTVSTRLLGKLESAKAGLAHAMPGATTEQVLEAALDLLLEKQARRRGLVKRLRSPAGTAAGEALRTAAGTLRARSLAEQLAREPPRPPASSLARCTLKPTAQPTSESRIGWPPLRWISPQFLRLDRSGAWQRPEPAISPPPSGARSGCEMASAASTRSTPAAAAALPTGSSSTTSCRWRSAGSAPPATSGWSAGSTTRRPLGPPSETRSWRSSERERGGGGELGGRERGRDGSKGEDLIHLR